MPAPGTRFRDLLHHSPTGGQRARCRTGMTDPMGRTLTNTNRTFVRKFPGNALAFLCERSHLNDRDRSRSIGIVRVCDPSRILDRAHTRHTHTE